MPRIKPGITIKTPQEIAIMQEGGKMLGNIKRHLNEMVKPGVSAHDLEEKAMELIEKTGGKASFAMVPGYHWATCVSVNDGVVHGIPAKTIVFKDGDLVSIDVGLFYKGFHTDTSASVLIGGDKETKRFFAAGKEALSTAIKAVKPGNYIYDISEAMESVLEKYGYSPVRALVGHGVGKELHEDPAIPCFTEGRREDTDMIKEGMTLAVEVMYTAGSPDLVMENDGWTIVTEDGKIAGLFEETVAVVDGKALVMTKAN